MKSQTASSDSVYRTVDLGKLEMFRKTVRFPRFSDKEYERRRAKIEKFIEKNGLHSLIICGGNTGWEKGWVNFRYATNYITADVSCFTVFSTKGHPILCCGFAGPWNASRSVYDDIRAGWNTALVAARRIKELGGERARIGIVDQCMKMPFDQWETFRTELPEAKFEFVTEKFWSDVRYPFSDEEVQAVEKAAQIGDRIVEALVAKIKPGMNESDVFAIAFGTTIANEGEPAMMLIGTTNMNNPDMPSNLPKFRYRKLGRGDIIISELGPVFNGYEAQSGRPITLGQPTQKYKEMAEIAFEAYRKVKDKIRPGTTEEELVSAASIIGESGYTSVGAPLLHGMHGALPYAGPAIGAATMPPEQRALMKSLPRPFKDLNFEPRCGVQTIEISVATKDEKSAVFIADPIMVGDDGNPRQLTKLPMQLFIIS